jgi:outer membrane immunogenic protein
MHRLLLLLAGFAALSVTAASAADIFVPPAPIMPLKAPPVPYTYYNWTGFYLGGEVGGAWATSQTTDITGGPSFPAGTVDNPISYTGILGGVYGGFNYQFNQIVIGLDGDYAWASIAGTGSDISTVNAHINEHSDNINWIATATGRIGYAMNNWLLFAKGGWAWAGFSGTSTEYTAAGTTVVDLGSASSTRSGWTAGGGVEYGLTHHVTVKLEYDYVDFGTANFSSTDVTVASGAVNVYQRSATSSLNMVKLGLDYKFW